MSNPYQDTTDQEFYNLLNRSKQQGSQLFQALMDKQAQEAGQGHQIEMQRQAQRAAASQRADVEAQGQRETQRNLETARQMLQSDPGYNVNITGGGGVALSKQRPEMNPMSYENFLFRKGQAQQNQVERIGKRIDSAKLPEQVANLQGAAAELPQQGQPFKSAGPILNYVPNFGVRIGESLGMLPEGATRERASLGALQALVRNPLFGATLTPQEKNDFEIAFGLKGGVSEDDVRAAISRMGGMMSSRLQNIESSSSPEALAEFQAQGGMSSKQLQDTLRQFAPKPKTLKTFIGGAKDESKDQSDDTAKRARLEELRLKKKSKVGP